MGTGSAWQEICRSIKEKVCYVALDFKAEQEKAKKSHDCNYNYELPSGDVITCNASRFEAPEALFNPNVIK
jgi:actin